MRHARPDDLDRLEDLLTRVRALGELSERSRGVFYRSSRAFLHFHADPAGLFADLRVGGEFRRYRVSTAAERTRLLSAARRVLRGEPTD